MLNFDREVKEKMKRKFPVGGAIAVVVVFAILFIAAVGFVPATNAIQETVFGDARLTRVWYGTALPAGACNPLTADLFFKTAAPDRGLWKCPAAGTTWQYIDLHNNQTAPTVAAGTGAGTGPTVTIGTGSTDNTTIVNVTTGTAPATSATIVTVTYAEAYTATPKTVLCTPNNALTAQIAVASLPVAAPASATTFTLTSAPAALTGSTAYSWQCLTREY